MSTVIAVRISKKLKEELDRLGINLAEEIRNFLMEKVKREKMKRLIKEIKELRSKSPRLKGNYASEYIREDRESR